MRAAEPPSPYPLPRLATDPFSSPAAPSASSSSSISFEDVGDMAEAPGFNILHLKCWARARARNAKQLAEYPSSCPLRRHP